MRHSLLLDPGALAAAFTLEIQFGAAYAAYFVHLNRFDIGRKQREGPFDAYAVGYLPDGERGCVTFALTFDDLTFEALDTLLVAFNDLVVDRDVIAGLEVRDLFFSRQLLVYKSYSSVHKTNFVTLVASFKGLQR